MWKTNIMILAIDLMTKGNIPGAQTFGFTMCHVLILETRNVHKLNTDKIILDICNNNLEVPITLNELGHTYSIGKVRGGKVQVITRFITYLQRQAVYSSKRTLKNNPNKMFITENLTTPRRKIIDKLNYLSTNRKVNACW